MIKTAFSCAGILLLFLPVSAQNDSLTVVDSLQPVFSDTVKQPIYKIKAGVDVPVFLVGGGWSLYAFTKIYSKEHSTEEKILSLDKNSINGFDRGAVRPFSESLDRTSYYTFFASMPLPFIFLTGKKTSKDFFKLGFLYLEAMSITGLLYTGSTYFANRYRPYAYSFETPMPQRTRGGAKN